MITSVENKIALLIDGDNAQSKFMESILTEAGKYGKVTVRRIYGDWTDTQLTGWKQQIVKHSIRPVQKFAFAMGKNSTDTAMIIDAMDILHSGAVTGFCIASSDSDYTGLAQRIREDGIFVMGIGEAKRTTAAFVNACDIFIFTENLIPLIESKQEPKRKNETQSVKVVSKEKSAIKAVDSKELPQSKITKKPIDLKFLMSGFEMVVDDTGSAYMGEIGVALRKIDPSFDSRTYGFSTITSLFKSLSDFFVLDYRDNGSSLFIKLKR